MNKELISTQSITIDTPAAKVWNALINPEMIKQYLFGTYAVSDWKVGSPISYSGTWNGKAYEDKGTILSIIPEKLLETTYWSGMSGKPDLPEYYKKVSYKLTPVAGGTRLIITQDNNTTEEEKNHTEQNWKTVLTSLKALLENQKQP